MICQLLDTMAPGAAGAHLTNTRSLALVGDADANASELLFSFSSPEEKNQFLAGDNKSFST